MSNHKDEIDKMRWSHSRLTAYEHCPYSFYLNYILHDDEQYLSEGNYFAEVGSFVHEILAMIFEGKLTIDEASEYYTENFDSNVFYTTHSNVMEHTYEACENYLALVDFAWLKDYEILGVEKKVEFELDGYKFIGFIDLLLKDKRDNKIIVVDHKSAAYPLKKDGTVKANSKKSFESYKRQMYLYSHAINLEFGEFPKFIMWNHFKDGGKIVSIPFKEREYKKAIKWAVDVIHKIEVETDYSPNQDYFYCNNLCNFRNSCEYNCLKDGR